MTSNELPRSKPRGIKISVLSFVNFIMVEAYWKIGRRIVKEEQGGKGRAEYGAYLIKELSRNLGEEFGRGFSVANLKYFRQFYVVYSNRSPKIRHKACGVLDDLSLAVEKSEVLQGFSPLLSWSHYRTLSKVEHKNERLFYEIEAEKEGWSVPVLERQIHSFLFARLLKS